MSEASASNVRRVIRRAIDEYCDAEEWGGAGPQLDDAMRTGLSREIELTVRNEVRRWAHMPPVPRTPKSLGVEMPG